MTERHRVPAYRLSLWRVQICSEVCSALTDDRELGALRIAAARDPAAFGLLMHVAELLAAFATTGGDRGVDAGDREVVEPRALVAAHHAAALIGRRVEQLVGAVRPHVHRRALLPADELGVKGE